MNSTSLSILVPVYNEEQAIQATLEKIQAACRSAQLSYELIVINDGSTDKTAERLPKNLGSFIRVLTHWKNRGYGASLKTGLRHASGEWVAIIDADGTYDPADLVRLYQLAVQRDLDMLVGDRRSHIAAVPWYRRPGKTIINLLVRFLLWQRIPDINSGLRMFRRSMAEKFIHLYPEGFSFTVTITLAAITSNFLVAWEPIAYHKRIGTSQMNFWRGLLHTFPNFLVLVIRIITYFKPLRFFLVPAAVFFLIGAGNLVRTLVYEHNVSDASLLLLLVSVQVGLMGLLADVVVKSRK